MLSYDKYTQSISTLRTLKPKTGYGAIGEDLVAGADAAEKRKVFSLVGLGPKFFQGKMVGKPLAGFIQLPPIGGIKHYVI